MYICLGGFQMGESLYSDIFQQAWQWRMVAEGLRWGGYGKDGGDFGSIEKRHWLL